MRIESLRPSPCGEGWLHDVHDIPAVLPRYDKPVRKVKDVTALAMKMFNDSAAAGERRHLADKLGVSFESLASLNVGVGWDRSGEMFYSFPSRGADCKIIGITRRYADGRKKTLAGTSNGVFVPENWWKLPGPISIVEGASDVAALVTHGFPALGRPSNTGGARIIAEYLKRRAKGRKVVVVGERDRKAVKGHEDCIGCAQCFPGIYGAAVVSLKLGCDWRIVPKFKDVREWASVSGPLFRDEYAGWINEPQPAPNGATVRTNDRPIK
jgi:hypothetical protein